MKVLVSNIGSTSFKFRLFDMAGDGERELACGGADRIGSADGGVLKLSVAGQASPPVSKSFADHGQAILGVLARLVELGVLESQAALDVVAFKAVLAGDVAPVERVTDELLERMEYFVPVAPAHNPPYIAAMKMFASALGDTPLVAAFEVGFHRTIPARRQHYAVPLEWADKYGVRRYGYHGASHAYIAGRVAELMSTPAGRIISCHLGGSSSICAIRDGVSVANSFGLSPQSGLPQTNRVGEFDPYAFSLLHRRAGLSAPAVLELLGSAGGLAGLSGTSGDMRDISKAIASGNGRAKLAMDVFVTAVRDYIGAYLLELGGAEAMVFTGGIGENCPALREAICEGLGFAGIVLDCHANAAAKGECRIDAPASRTALWVMPTNEEIIVARQAVRLLTGQTART